MALLLLVSWALGGRVKFPGEFPKPFPKHLLKAVVAATGASLLEEILFRGYLRVKLTGALSAFLYAIVHFFRPVAGSDPSWSGYHPFEGFQRFPIMIESFRDPRLLTLGVLSLFLIGMALNRLAERTGTLWAGIGLHSGLVFTVELYRRWLWDRPQGSPWIYGGGRLHDGVLGCLMAGALLLLVNRLPLPRSCRPASKAPPPPPPRSDADPRADAP